MKSIVVVSMLAVAAQSVSFRAGDGRLLYGDAYGSGDRGVVILAHGGYSSRASWKPTAEVLEAEGFHVLIFESRGAADFAAGKETPCLSDEVCQSRDVVAAIRHMRRLGARTISLVGGSLGGAAVALAAIDAGPRSIDSVVLLAPAAIAAPEKIPVRLLFIAARNDANAAGLRLPGIREQSRTCPVTQGVPARRGFGARAAHPVGAGRRRGDSRHRPVPQGPNATEDVIYFADAFFIISSRRRHVFGAYRLRTCCRGPGKESGPGHWVSA